MCVDDQYNIGQLQEIPYGGSLCHDVVQVGLEVGEGLALPRIVSVPSLGNLVVILLKFHDER